MATSDASSARNGRESQASNGEAEESKSPAVGTMENPIQVPLSQSIENLESIDRPNGLLQQDISAEALASEPLPHADGLRNDKVNGDLKAKDWNDLEARFTLAIEKAVSAENVLLNDFGRYANAFSYWAQAGSQHDDERAVKRIRTQERYVQLSEQKLAAKKQHYEQVVQAFTAALRLLRE